MKVAGNILPSYLPDSFGFLNHCKVEKKSLAFRKKSNNQIFKCSYFPNFILKILSGIVGSPVWGM